MDAFVEMTGVGSASAAPDVVSLDLSVRSPGGSVAEALGAADHGMAAIIDIARQHSLAGRDLQTTSASVYPQYDQQGVSVIGYLAQQSLRLRVRDRSLVGTLINAFSTAIGNTLTVDNIGLQIDDPAPLLTLARQGAFEDAARKAHQFADLAGRQLGPVLFVVDSPASAFPGPVARGAMMKFSSEDTAAGMAVEVGENAVSAHVTVRWAWA
ncbi:SIMPL domain-containing protein [Nostocoides sp.]|uniref:SIMPL domain-containing protein n=1 Tax=Nostocoides sp. TaxID=1917966 RepID=UPI003BB0C8AA